MRQFWRRKDIQDELHSWRWRCVYILTIIHAIWFLKFEDSKPPGAIEQPYDVASAGFDKIKGNLETAKFWRTEDTARVSLDNNTPGKTSALEISEFLTRENIITNVQSDFTLDSEVECERVNNMEAFTNLAELRLELQGHKVSSLKG